MIVQDWSTFAVTLIIIVYWSLKFIIINITIYFRIYMHNCVSFEGIKNHSVIIMRWRNRLVSGGITSNKPWRAVWWIWSRPTAFDHLIIFKESFLITYKNFNNCSIEYKIVDINFNVIFISYNHANPACAPQYITRYFRIYMHTCNCLYL